MRLLSSGDRARTVNVHVTLLAALLLAASCATSAPEGHGARDVGRGAPPRAVESVSASLTPHVLDSAGSFGPLRVSVFPASDSGTMGFADRVLVEAGDRGSWIRETSMELNVVAPVVERIIPLGDDAVLLLGWSASSGADTSYHALVVRVGTHDVALADELVLGAAGWSGGLVVSRRDGRTRVGAAIPACATDGAQPCILDARAGSHVLAHGFRVDLSSAPDRLQLYETPAAPEDDLYRPRANASEREPLSIDGAPMTVVWFNVRDGVFVPEPADRVR